MPLRLATGDKEVPQRVDYRSTVENKARRRAAHAPNAGRRVAVRSGERSTLGGERSAWRTSIMLSLWVSGGRRRLSLRRCSVIEQAPLAASVEETSPIYLKHHVPASKRAGESATSIALDVASRKREPAGCYPRKRLHTTQFSEKTPRVILASKGSAQARARSFVCRCTSILVA
jgi:hypothetical protein